MTKIVGKPLWLNVPGIKLKNSNKVAIETVFQRKGGRAQEFDSSILV